jgi:hypothetical protein
MIARNSSRFTFFAGDVTIMPLLCELVVAAALPDRLALPEVEALSGSGSTGSDKMIL